MIHLIVFCAFCLPKSKHHFPSNQTNQTHPILSVAQFDLLLQFAHRRPVNQVNHRITLKAVFDLSPVQVMVMDNGLPQLSSTTRVVIKVEDANDHSPEFDQKLYKVQIPSNAQIDQAVFQVSCRFYGLLSTSSPLTTQCFLKWTFHPLNTKFYKLF